MRLTDLFIRRPVLAIVVNLVILIAGIQSIRSLSRAPVPAHRHRADHGHDRLHRRQRRPRARLHHHAARARDRVAPTASTTSSRSSAQGVSTITVHLKLNYDTNAALTQIQAKVAQVRNDLPPEAEAPIIELDVRGRRSSPRCTSASPRRTSTRARSPTT